MSKRLILAEPGVDIIDAYGDQAAPRGGCAGLVIPGLILLLVIGITIARNNAAAAPEQIPTAAGLPTITATATPSDTPTPTASATASPTEWPTMTPTNTATITPTATATASPTATLIPWIIGTVAGARELNVRYGPGTNYPTMGHGQLLPEGTTVQIVGRDNGARWARISQPMGWISMAYVDSENIARLPVVEAPPPVRD